MLSCFAVQLSGRPHLAHLSDQLLFACQNDSSAACGGGAGSSKRRGTIVLLPMHAAMYLLLMQVGYLQGVIKQLLRDEQAIAHVSSA